MKFTVSRKMISFCFVLYVAVMLWLLFIRYRTPSVTDYWFQVASRINLVPFSSIGGMLSTLRRYPRLDVLWVVVYNLLGNIIMFVPLGFFLPALWARFRKILPCVVGVAGIMICVELVQLFTLRGFCETDDVILNVTGGAIGYGIWKITKSWNV